ncbi:hypothetical protein N39L_59780 [Limnospira platensis NIES-39]|jgi:hypothetical protein|uniref:Uncharacterized protein n=1 Tax=Limnospira platensis NIES-46 TaxID=1236695 RepID=A0A5M3T9W5_LIMPL|nr:hypothetical protein N39L_59780 [Arthrospira platensis NIES-39]GCE94596.1 hypothetical protein NIES46_26550 [Arthrospira platensis NIES-46]
MYYMLGDTKRGVNMSMGLDKLPMVKEVEGVSSLV